MNFTNITLDNLQDCAKKIIQALPNEKIFLLYGQMGVGKTTLTKHLCEALGVQDPISSPTYSIVNEYLAADGSVVYHFDFYRIKDQWEAFDIGFEEYLYSGAYCFIEWPERIPELIPEHHVSVHMKAFSEATRDITLEIVTKI